MSGFFWASMLTEKSRLGDSDSMKCCDGSYQTNQRILFTVLLLTVCGWMGLTLFGTPVCRAVAPSDLKYFKLVQMPGIGESQLVYIRLDDELYKFANTDYADIRVFTSKKVELPRLIEQEMTENGPREETYETGDVEVRYDADARQTIIDVAMNRQPLTRFEVMTGGQPFRGDITVQAKQGDQWKKIRLKSDGSFEETRSMEYRLVLADIDPPGLTIDSVKATGNSYRILYLADAGNAFQLFWGADSISKPGADVSAIRAALNSGQPVKRARVGRGFANPEGGGTDAANPRGFLNSRWFFVILIVLILFIVGSALTKAVRKEGK